MLNFSAKNSACRKTKQTDSLSIPAIEEWPYYSTDSAAVLLCLRTELVSLQVDDSAPKPPKHTRFLLPSCIFSGT